MRNIVFITLLCVVQVSCQTTNTSESNQDLAPFSGKNKFIWDFDSNNIYKYSYTQTIKSISLWEVFSDTPDTTNSIMRGILLVKSQGNGKAKIILDSLRIQKIEVSLTPDKIPEERFVQDSPLVIQDIKANGDYANIEVGAGLIVSFLFPLPQFDFKLGEEEIMDLQMPFNLMGSPLTVNGYQSLNYVEEQTISKPNFSRFESKIKIDKLEVPEEIKGEFKSVFTGEGVYKFNAEGKYFQSAFAEIDMLMNVKPGESNSEQGNNGMSMHSIYELTLLEIYKE